MLGLVRLRTSFANVVAMLALAVALSGTAYAAGLGKNTVGSKQIKDNKVASRDIKDGTLTGADVNEGALTTVPDAAALGGLGPAAYQRAPFIAQGNFTETDDLDVTVPGYGSFNFFCIEPGTFANLEDETVRFRWNHLLGAGKTGEILIAASPNQGTDMTTNLVTPIAGASSVLTLVDDREWVDALFHTADGSKVVRVVGNASDDTATNGCYGTLTAQVLK